MLAGKLWIGRHGFAAEIGHMPLLVDGPLCACGAQGCLESLIGTPAILARYERWAGGGTGGAEKPPGRALLTPKEIALRAEQGDMAARQTYAETGHFLGSALRGLTHLFDPDLFVIGGGISGAWNLMAEAAEEALLDHLLMPRDLAPQIRPAALGHAAGWIGAALYGSEQAGRP